MDRRNFVRIGAVAGFLEFVANRSALRLWIPESRPASAGIGLLFRRLSSRKRRSPIFRRECRPGA